jgi:hypothetical protein
MKKLTLGAIALLVIVLGVFFWLVSGASPDNAPQEAVAVELPDSYEK